MTEARETALRRLGEGDIVYADIADSGTAVCLVLEVTETAIQARDICRDGEFIFDRMTGVAPCPWQNNRLSCRITSVARLPPDMHDVLVRYHEKFVGRASVPIEEWRMSDEEIRAFGGATDIWEEETLP
jgi:hypothetical protein